jgi:endonuclease/exonuclease/phosphatase family metal-dependent hydrolase
MRRIITLVLFIVTIAGGGFFFSKYKIDGLENVVFSPRDSAATAGSSSKLSAGEPREANTVRVASFNIQVFGSSKASKPQVMSMLAEIVRQFDVVAIQEVRSKDQTLIPNFVRQINADGAKYEFVLGPRLGRTVSKEQYAFIFDSEKIEVDRSSVYTLSDPHDRMHREPLVALFRTRGPSSSEAFTFKLVNVHTDPDDVPEEMAALADVYRAVANDGDGEDDVIMLGDFNTSEKKLYQVAQVSPTITTALADVMTNTRGTKAYDNLIFDGRHTSEFLGRSGVLDLVSVFKSTQEEILKVSDHLPVWGDFSAYENRGANRLASSPDGTPIR